MLERPKPPYSNIICPICGQAVGDVRSWVHCPAYQGMVCMPHCYACRYQIPWNGHCKYQTKEAKDERKIKKPPCIKKRKNAGRLFLTFVGTKVLYKYCTTDARKSQEECRCIRLGGLVMGINVLTKPQDTHTAENPLFQKDKLSFSDEGSKGKMRDEARLPLGGRPWQKAKGLWKSC